MPSILKTSIALGLISSSAAALAMPRSAAVKTNARAAPTHALPQAASAMQLAKTLRGGGDFATSVAPVIGAGIANAMFLSGFGEVGARPNVFLVLPLVQGGDMKKSFEWIFF